MSDVLLPELRISKSIKRKRKRRRSLLNHHNIRNMDSSSEEDIKKRGWLLVNTKGSVEASSDEELVSSEATADNIAKDNPVISPLELEPGSPTVLSPGSASSGGSTLVSGLPSPLPSHHKTPALDSVEENLSSVVNILKAKVEKEDSFSVDSFEVLSEEPEAGHSMDSQSEDLLDERDNSHQQQPIQQHRFVSDSDSDFVKLRDPSEMESAPSGIEGISQDPHTESSEVRTSSLQRNPGIQSHPKNAPYEDVRDRPVEEEPDHVRIMSRRWPTEDGGFLLVQRFRKLEQDAASTVSSSISDFSSFSMVERRQRLLSDTQEAGEESDVESVASDSSFTSEETLPVNMTVRTLPPAVKQYLHQRNDVFNSKLTIFAVLVLTAGLTLGIGHFVGSSQMVTHHQSIQEGQKLRLRSLQDELVSCMDKRKEATRLLQEKERDMNQCMKKMEASPEPSVEENGQSGHLHTSDLYDPWLCSQCHEGQLRYSKFCNTVCSVETERGHSWVTMEMNSPTTGGLKGDSAEEEKEGRVTPPREQELPPSREIPLDCFVDDSGDAEDYEATSVQPSYNFGVEDDNVDEGTGREQHVVGGTVSADNEGGVDVPIEIDEDNPSTESEEDGTDSPTEQHASDDGTNSVYIVFKVPRETTEETFANKQTAASEGDDNSAKWICIDGNSDDTCTVWVPKEDELVADQEPTGDGSASGEGSHPELLESENTQLVIDKNKVEETDSSVGHRSDSEKLKEDDVNRGSSVQEILQSAWSMVENASTSFLEKKISLQNTTDIVKDHVQDLQDLAETSWESIHSAAVQVNEQHVQPMVSKVTQLMKQQVSAKRGKKGKNRGGRSCRQGRNKRQIAKQAIKKKKALKKEQRHTARELRRKENQNGEKKGTLKQAKTKNMKNNAKLNPIVRATEKRNESKFLNVNSKSGSTKASQHQKSQKKKSSPSKEAKADDEAMDVTKNPKEDVPKKQKPAKHTPPPKLNIEKLLDSLDMSCGGEVRCVENHKMDAARLLKEMISYRQWLWEQRFRKDVDEVEDFMEELEEFIEEENVDDEDIEDLKGEFEDMVEDIQKTTKKFFRKQENKSKQENTAKKSKNQGKIDGKSQLKKSQVDVKQERKKGTLAEGDSRDATGKEDTVHKVTFKVEDLPSLQLANFSTSSLSDSKDELNEGEVSKDDNSETKLSPINPGTDGYLNTDQWFFRRARHRELRRGKDPDSEWYFKRFHFWEQDRKMKEQKDWYFQRGNNRETFRGCPTQPRHCDWAKDESVVTVWEMYKWLTERFSIRADLRRAWDLEDQINWFLRRP